MKQIGEELGVGFMLAGTVRWDRAEGAGSVRITPRLIRVVDDTHVWADSYDRVLDDVFAAQSEIAKAVVVQLGVALLPAEQQALAARPTESPEAYQAYLRGLVHLRDPDWTRESFELAVQMFDRAVAYDPTFVEAHALLAQAHVSMYTYDSTPERLARAREAADRALALDPESPDAHLALGQYHEAGRTSLGTRSGDFERALEEYTFVARRRPNDSVAENGIGWLRVRQGRFAEGIAQLERALDADPRNASYADDLGSVYRLLARYAEAERYHDLAISLAPDKLQAYVHKASHYMEQGRLDRARSAAEAVPELDHFQSLRLWVELERREGNYQAALARLAAARSETLPGFALGWKEVAEGQLHHLTKQPERARASYESAVAILKDALAEHPDDLRPRAYLAQAYAGLGRKAEAIREADRVVQASPVSRDAFTGTAVVLYTAEAYTAAGEHEIALDLLESLASIPSWMSYGYIRFEPAFDPLRDHPRFQKLLADKKKQLPPL